MLYLKRTISSLLKLVYYSNRTVTHCDKVSFQDLADCSDNDLEYRMHGIILEHNAERL